MTTTKEEHELASTPEAQRWFDGLSADHQGQVTTWLRDNYPPSVFYRFNRLDYAYNEMIRPGTLLSFLNRL